MRLFGAKKWRGRRQKHAQEHGTLSNTVALVSSVFFLFYLHKLPIALGESNDPRHPTFEEARIQQIGSSLCTQWVCTSGDGVRPLMEQQFHLSQLPHNCRDSRGHCDVRARDGDCLTDSEYMHAYCPKACGVCHNRTRLLTEGERYSDTVTLVSSNTTRRRFQYRKRGKLERAILAGKVINDTTTSLSPQMAPLLKLLETTTNNTSTDISPTGDIRFLDAAGSDMGVPQILYSGVLRDSILRLLRKTRKQYMPMVQTDNRYRLVRESCRNYLPYCAAWAVLGECDNNYEYMSEECAPVCRTCEVLHAEAKCPIDYTVKHALYPGELNQLFERIVQEYSQTHPLEILSSPTAPRPGPWLVMIDDFVTPAEAKRLIELGALEGYKRSEDVGDEDEFGEADGVVSSGRTSTNAWCEPKTCERDPAAQQVVSKIERLTGIHRNYSEVLQLLRYEPGQFYEEHHDYIDIDRDRIQGCRILTVFLYLNDVEEGGETDFPALGLKVKPKRGRAVIWPSVLDDRPHDKDERTNHQALPVVKGIKYGANAWIHQRHFRVATYELFC